MMCIIVTRDQLAAARAEDPEKPVVVFESAMGRGKYAISMMAAVKSVDDSQMDAADIEINFEVGQEAGANVQHLLVDGYFHPPVDLDAQLVELLDDTEKFRVTARISSPGTTPEAQYSLCVGYSILPVG